MSTCFTISEPLEPDIDPVKNICSPYNSPDSLILSMYTVYDNTNPNNSNINPIVQCETKRCATCCSFAHRLWREFYPTTEDVWFDAVEPPPGSPYSRRTRSRSIQFQIQNSMDPLFSHCNSAPSASGTVLTHYTLGHNPELVAALTTKHRAPVLGELGILAHSAKPVV